MQRLHFLRMLVIPLYRQQLRHAMDLLFKLFHFLPLTGQVSIVSKELQTNEGKFVFGVLTEDQTATGR